MDAIASDGESATSLTALLNRVAADRGRSSQLYRLLGEFWHEVRNELNGLKVSLYLARSAGTNIPSGTLEGLEVAQARYDEFELLVERLHKLCKGLPIVPMALPLNLFFEERRLRWESSLRARNRRLILEPADEKEFGQFDPGRLGCAFDDLFAWRLLAAEPGADLRIGWKMSVENVSVEWTEHPTLMGRPTKGGKGLSAIDPETPPRGSRPLALLSMPLLTQTIALHGGRVTPLVGRAWGLRVEWPRSIPNPSGLPHVEASRDAPVGPGLAPDRPLRSAR